MEVQSLDGSGNNRANPEWGVSNGTFTRISEPNYADGIGELVEEPEGYRWLSNRIYNDVHQNLFSENQVTQWAATWAQFVGHTNIRRQAAIGDDPVVNNPIPFDPDDPLEGFSSPDREEMPLNRSQPAEGTGVDTPRQHVNRTSSYIDAAAVYSPLESRLEWLREGPFDGDLSNNGAELMLVDGYLPRWDSRGADTPPPGGTEFAAHTIGSPERAMVAGDLRSNQSLTLTGLHTLFAREHNRIVGQLPDHLSEEVKFEVARRVVIAELQYVTYEEFLPTLGVDLPRYTGYDPRVQADVSNEFSAVGMRGHSMFHGEFEAVTGEGTYTPEQLAAFQEMGITVEARDDEIELEIPLTQGVHNPDLFDEVGIDPLLRGLGANPQYKNDEQIDNQLRSTLFQVPVSGNPECVDGPNMPDCYTQVIDLGAINAKRSRDAGIPGYNDLREAYGLDPVSDFTEVTGEDTQELPDGLSIDDPAILDYVELTDPDGEIIAADENNEGCLTCEAESEAVDGTQRSTLAARLNAIYDSPDDMDAFTGMSSEPNIPGTELGELELAMWTQEFTKLRDGDRFFHRNVPVLDHIARHYGIDYRRSLAEIVADNTDIELDELQENVFLTEDANPESPPTCTWPWWQCSRP